MIENLEKPRIAISFDLGTTSVGWSILKINSKEVSNENLEIIDMGVRLFDDVASKDVNVETRRVARSRRRRINRQRIRKSDLCKLLIDFKIVENKEDFEQKIRNSIFDSFEQKWLMPLDIKIKGLDNELNSNELTLILHNYIKHRGTLNTIDQSEESEKELEKLQNNYNKALFPCQNQQNLFNITGKVLGNKENSVISNEDWQKEIIKILNNQKWINNLESFKNEYLKLFSRCRHYSQGPGSEKSPSPYGLYRIDEKTNQVKKIGENLWDSLIGKCSYYKEEPRNFKKSPITEFFNLLNDFANMKVTNEEKYLSLDQKLQILKQTTNYKDLTLDKFLKKIELKKEDIKSGLKHKDDKFEIEKLETTKKLYKWLVDNGFLKEINFSIEQIQEIDKIFSIANKKQNVKERFETLWNNKEIFKSKSFNNVDINQEMIQELAQLKIWSSGTSSLSSKAQLEFINWSLSDPDSVGKNQMNFFQENKENNQQDKIFEKYKYFPNNYFENEIMPLTVKRTFNQTIKVLNSILQNKKYSKYQISHIFIELAREMNSKDEKKNIENELRQNKKYLENKIKEFGVDESRLKYGENRIKFLLWIQQNKQDLYDGKDIDLNTLLNDPQAYNIEHVIPESVSLNDSMANKVLASTINNQQKGDLTPYQWLSKMGKFEDYEKRCLNLLNNVQSAKDKAKLKSKIENYLLYKKDPDEELTGFVSRQLNDTRYISTLLFNELNSFFKQSDYWKNQKIIIQPINGVLTSFARKNWFSESSFEKQQRLLIKNRDIYSHHAIDATIIGFLGLNSNIQKLLKFKNKNIVKKNVDGKIVYVDRETGEVSYEKQDFLKYQSQISQYFEKQMRDFLDKSIKSKWVKFSRMVERKNNSPLSNETLYSILSTNEFDNKGEIINKFYKIDNLKLLDLTEEDLDEYFWDETILNNLDQKQKDKYEKSRNSLIVYHADKTLYNELKTIYLQYKENKKNNNPFIKYLNSDFVKESLKIDQDVNLDKIPIFINQKENNTLKIKTWVKKLKIKDSEINPDEILKLKNHSNKAFYDSLKPLAIRIYKDKNNKYQSVFINALNVKWDYKNQKLIVDEEKIKKALKDKNIESSRFLEINKGKTLILNNDLYYFNGGGNRNQNQLELKILSMKNELAHKNSNWNQAPSRDRWQIKTPSIARDFKLCKVDPLGNVYDIFSFDEYFENNMLKY